MRRHLDLPNQVLLAIVCLAQQRQFRLSEGVLFQMMSRQHVQHLDFQARLQHLREIRFLQGESHRLTTSLTPTAFTALSWGKAEDLLTPVITSREERQKTRIKEAMRRSQI